MRDLNQKERDLLESFVDSCGLSSVLMSLSEICGEKADHVRANWQDNNLAHDWDTAEGHIGVVVPSIVARGL